MSTQPSRFPATAVVDLASSDDEDAAIASRSNNTAKKPAAANLATNSSAATQSANANYQPLDNRSFWRAGGYEVGRTKSVQIEGDLEHARVHPKFLHSNATSHKWAFGAIAELLDNAVDEIRNGATFVKVDRIYNPKENSPALVFHDDGGGMDPDGMRKCMSLGYSSKTSNTTIGQYGNGFKTSTMRLGADVIVFTRATRSGRSTQSVGLLSYTFLRRTRQDDVIVPMIDFDTSDHWAEPLVYGSLDDWSNNLKTILEWSPFASKEDLMLEFGNIGSHGTKIIIYNLWMNDEGIYELNFDDDEEDIRLRDETSQGNASKARRNVIDLQSHLSYRIRFSLRAYASILYLRNFTNFRIILRGKPVEQFSIAKDLNYSKPISYRPYTGAAEEVVVETTIGFIKEAPALGVCGYNIYHKNRLIRPYWKVTADGSSKGHGVVGVLEANFIEPAHDKQDFERSSLFLKLETRLKQMVMEYWRGHCHLIGHLPDGVRKSDMPQKLPTQPQVQAGGLRNQSIITSGHMSPVPTQPQVQADGLRNQSITSGHMSPVPTQPQVQAGGLHTQSITSGTGHMSPVQLISGATARQQLQLPGTVSSAVQQVSGHNSVSVPEASLDIRPLNEICDENIQLFMRCEEYKEKEVELKRKVEELEKELQETKNKCARISSHLESQRKEAHSALGW